MLEDLSLLKQYPVPLKASVEGECAFTYGKRFSLRTADEKEKCFSLQYISLFGKIFSVDVMNVSYKNYLFHLTGCTVFLFVGARTQSVKADYLEPGFVEAHWRDNPKVFQETFDALSKQADKLHLLSEEFPNEFKERNGDLYTVITSSNTVITSSNTVKTSSNTVKTSPNIVKMSSSSKDLSFHTLGDLEKLPCYTDLKEIIKVVGSTEFLKKVLPEEVVKSILAHATSSKYTKITFEQHLEGGFFNGVGKGTLHMKIEQFPEGSEVKKEDSFMVSKGLECTFYFVFEKEDDLTVLKEDDPTVFTECEASYAFNSGEARMWFVKKTERISDFQWDVGIVKKAQEKFPSVYAKLRGDLNGKNGKKREYKDFEICLDAKFGRKRLMDSCSKSHDVSTWEAVRPLSKVLITEDFLEGIFGKAFWNIFEYYGQYRKRRKELLVDFDVSRCAEGYKVSCKFENRHRGNMERDVTAFGNEPLNWEWLDFGYIHFVFFYDPQKDEISHVRLQDKLVLNYELISKSNRTDGLIAMDNEANPFEKIQEQYDASNRSDDEDPSDPEGARQTDPNG